MSTLPKQLQDQVTVAESFYKPAEKEATDVAEVTAAVAESPASEQPAVVDTISKVEDENSETYMQRWKSLQGIQHSTAQRARFLEDRVGQLEGLIASMQRPTEAAQPAPVAKQHLTDKDSEEYGSDMVDFVRRAVAEGTAALQDENRALRQDLQRLNGVVPAVQQVAQQQRMTQEERFWGNLQQAVPEWQRINDNQAFKDWLLTPDPMTGITRQTYLEDAQQGGDVARVANIFTSWQTQFGKPVNAKQQSASRSIQNELEKQIAPGRTQASASPNVAEAKQWSTSDIAKFYDDVRKGAFKGRDGEMQALERDIFLAQREGRVT
jgi:hypothetical protein